MSILSEGIAWLDEQRNDHLSEMVVYTRSGYPDLTIAAAMGKTVREVMDEAGQTTKSSSVDFIVSSGSLLFGGESKPVIGDRIYVTESDGSIKTFEVLDMMGEGHFAWADPQGKVLRIHTKLVDSINA